MNKGFGVAAKAVIFKDDKVLVIRKSDKDEINPNTYDLPGGRVEFGEEPVEALHREVMEETGLKVSILGPSRVGTFKKDDEFQLVGITFACDYLEGIEALSFEHDEFKWLATEEIQNSNLPTWIKEEVSAALRIKDGY